MRSYARQRSLTLVRACNFGGDAIVDHVCTRYQESSFGIALCGHLYFFFTRSFVFFADASFGEIGIRRSPTSIYFPTPFVGDFGSRHSSCCVSSMCFFSQVLQHLSTLGVRNFVAGSDEVKAAYRGKAMALHPDRYPTVGDMTVDTTPPLHRSQTVFARISLFVDEIDRGVFVSLPLPLTPLLKPSIPIRNPSSTK